MHTNVALWPVGTFPSKRKAPLQTLKKFLFSEYGKPLPPSVADPAHATPVTLFVDDFKSTDQAHLFCRVAVNLDDTETFELKLSNAPVSSSVRDFVRRKGGEVEETVRGTEITMSLPLRHSAEVGKLAKAIRRQVGRGERYDDPNWKWACPRTAESLARLNMVLRKYRSAKANDQL